MNKLENKQNISDITMYPMAYTKCEIGGDWYKNELDITFTPNKYYPDYMEVNKWICENIDGHTLNIEDVVDKVYAFLNDTYEPAYLHITDSVCNCKTHFDVVVEK